MRFHRLRGEDGDPVRADYTEAKPRTGIVIPTGHAVGPHSGLLPVLDY